MLYLTVILSIGMFAFIMVFCCTIAFVFGCAWVGSRKKERERMEVFDERDVYNPPVHLRKVK